MYIAIARAGIDAGGLPRTIGIVVCARLARDLARRVLILSNHRLRRIDHAAFAVKVN
jgi:hypothetical protein